MAKISKWVILLIFALFSGISLAQDNETLEESYAVKVTATKLNVRTGIGLSFRRICIVDKETKLAVVNEKLGWLEVMLPLNAPCWTFAKLVEVEDNQGVIKSNRVNVRTSPRAKSSGNIIGQLTKGTPVTILESNSNWYKIAPPESLTGWVNKKYAKYWGTYKKYKKWIEEEREAKTSRSNRKAELKEKFKKAGRIYESESSKPYLDQDFTEALTLYQEIVEYSENKELVTKSKDRIRFIGPRQQILGKYREAISQKDQKIEEVRTEYIDKIRKLLAQMTEKPAYTAQGWIDSVGKIFNRPGTHRLVKGGQTQYFLKSNTVNLDDYYKRLVGIRGRIVEIPGWPQETIIVDEIKILSEE